MQLPAVSRAVPIAAGIGVAIAGALQFTKWKARQLACCREKSDCAAVPSTGLEAAWRHGVRLGIGCTRCCFGFMAVLLSVGIMDLPAMALVTGAVTAERLAPEGVVAHRATGAVAIGTGLILIARAIAFI